MSVILTETQGRVAVIRLNRPEALNALNTEMIAAIGDALDRFDRDESVGAILITGSERAFAAGADIREMASLTFAEAYAADYAAGLQRVAEARKPIVAAVAGHCLGGGCELAQACDIVIAADSARFAQPEITLGIIPGMGGTQRLPRAVGKAKAMEMILTGRAMDAAEAERAGLVARVVPAVELMPEAMKVARHIATLPLAATMAAKEAVRAAFETPLGAGIAVEKRLFHALFSTDDQKEGMAAFLAKRPPSFRNR
jgi:enoyl-CoA hydratase